MIVLNLSAPTGIPDDHELARIWGYQPVHAGWISPLDRMVAKAYLQNNPLPDQAPVDAPIPVPATAGTTATVSIPYASVSEMQGLGNPLLARLAETTADDSQLALLTKLQKRQTFFQLISTSAIVVIATTAVLSAIYRKNT